MVRCNYMANKCFLPDRSKVVCGGKVLRITLRHAETCAPPTSYTSQKRTHLSGSTRNKASDASVQLCVFNQRPELNMSIQFMYINNLPGKMYSDTHVVFVITYFEYTYARLERVDKCQQTQR